MLNKITGYSPIKSGSGVKKTTHASGVKSFAELLDVGGSEEPAGISSLSDIAATSAVGNMLALQEITEEDLRRKKLTQQGSNMLETLEKLRQQLLIGAIPLHTLVDLKRQLSIHKQGVTDPRLTAIIEDIELRVAVELAKLEMAVLKPIE